MKPLIPPSFYTDPDIFAKEQKLWQKNWTFIGTVDNLQNHNDYICADVGGQTVVVQNFNGQLRAFQNVCTHRFTRIQRGDKGNGPLQCPYHGWKFNSEGVPINVLRQAEFDHLTEAEKGNLQLEAWQVDQCGTWVFIKRDDQGPGLKDYLGKTYELILEFSAAMGKQVDFFEKVIQANWKLFVENTLEGYHLLTVHGKTFGKYAAVEDEVFLSDSPHFHYHAKPVKAGKAILHLVDILADRDFQSNRYHHYVVFPSLVFWTSQGVILTVSTVHPIGPQETLVKNYVYLCKMSPEQEQKLQECGLLAPELLGFPRVVTEEDFDICQQVQLGLNSLTDNNYRGGIFSQAEQQVYEYHQAYMEALGFAPEPVA